MERLLSGADWKLEGYLPYGHVFNNESGIDFHIWPVVQAIPARVPGSVHADLHRAGIIEDPYFGFNSLKCEWVENKEWRYFKTFALAPCDIKKHMRLVMEGLNFRARIYLNGIFLGAHENVHTECAFWVQDILREKNLLEILLLPVPPDEAQMGRTSESILQGERFAYGWDFCTRLVGIGVWKDVKLVGYDEAALGDCFVSSDLRDKGVVSVEGHICGETGGEVNVSLSYRGEEVACQSVPAAKEWSVRLEVEDPALWYPAGYGAQPLYDVRVTLLKQGEKISERCYRTGIRRLEYASCEGAPDGAIRYTVKINGEKIYLNGVNFLPIDHQIGAVTDERYQNQLELVRRGNFNLIRLWGGGVKEKEILFDLCDEKGILVWQDFTQSNSGIDGIPCKKKEFLKEFLQSSREIIQSDRNHVCTVIYCGGNELKDEKREPVGYEDGNIRLLADLVASLDPGRIFHPSCPSGPNFNFQVDEESARRKKNHNIHGQWAYMGKELHYSYYGRGDYMYQGEFGVNGCSDESSLLRFMGARECNGFRESDALWTFRNYTWWNSYAREKDIFGEEGVRDISRYAPASQLVQGEGLRYILERNRSRAFACCGNNIWQFSEPCPNPNCSNLVDYYLRPKQAYYMVRNSNRTLNVNLRYDKIYYERGEKFSFPVTVGNFGGETDCEVQMQIRTATTIVSQKTIRLNAKKGAQNIALLEDTVSEKYGDLFFVRLKATRGQQSLCENLYIFGTSKTAPYAPLFDMTGTLQACLLTQQEKTFVRLKNTGNVPVLFAEIYAEDCGGLFFEDNFVTLFGGEMREIGVEGREKRALYVKDFTRNTLLQIKENVQP